LDRSALPEPAAILRPDEWLLAADLQLLHSPRVPVRIAEAEERAAVIGAEDHDLAALDAAIDELLPCRPCIRDHELQAADRARLHLALRGQVTEHDRAARATRRELDDVHELRGGVVVEVESDLVAVERDRPIDIADGQDHDFERPVHAVVLPGRNRWGTG